MSSFLRKPYSLTYFNNRISFKRAGLIRRVCLKCYLKFWSKNKNQMFVSKVTRNLLNTKRATKYIDQSSDAIYI